MHIKILKKKTFEASLNGVYTRIIIIYLLTKNKSKRYMYRYREKFSEIYHIIVKCWNKITNDSKTRKLFRIKYLRITKLSWIITDI